MATALPYESYHNVLLGLYVQDDLSDAVDVVYRVRTLLGREVVELDTWFPRWKDETGEVFLEDDVYSLSVRENLLTALIYLGEGGGAALLDRAGRVATGFEPETQLFFGRIATPVLVATVLACRQVDQTGALLLVIADGEGGIDRILRLRVGESEGRISRRLHEIVERVLTACCTG